jgi:hypothetical protein
MCLVTSHWNTVKSAHAFTSNKQSPVLKGHNFLVLYRKFQKYIQVDGCDQYETALNKIMNLWNIWCGTINNDKSYI